MLDEALILQNMESEEDRQAEAVRQLKTLYDHMGEEACLAAYRVQTGEELPEELDNPP